MGTRGLFGLVINDEVKATYNHWDSYPSGLGADVVKTVQSFLTDPLGEDDLAALTTLAEKLLVVDDNSEPTPEQIEEFRTYADTGVSTGNLSEWYVLLRNLQGNLYQTLHAGIMIDGKNFASDSLFCEWGYLVNVDNHTLEVYKGFQTDKDKVVGRFADAPIERQHRGENQYYPISLVAVIPFDRLDEFDTRMQRVQMQYDLLSCGEYWHKENKYPEEYIAVLENAVRELTDLDLVV